MYEKYMKEGKLWGMQNDKYDYFPKQSLRYLENQTLSKSVSKLFPLLSLEGRRGSGKVKRFFDVDTLNPSKLSIKIKEAHEHVSSIDFELEVEELKPFIYALRVKEDSGKERSRIQNLKVKLCSSLDCSVEINQEKVNEIKLKYGESIIVDSIAYLVAEPYDISRKSLVVDPIISGILGEIFSTIVEVNIADSVARLATCPPPMRIDVLNQITSGTGRERLENANTYFKNPEIDEESITPNIPPKPVPPTPNISDLGTQSAPLVNKPSTVGPVSVSAEKPIIVSPSRHIKRRIKVNSKPLATSKHPQADADRSESVAMQFEIAHGRFPEPVSHFQGSDAYGCDILSFATEQDNRSFKSNPDKHLIARFIEAKGRTNEKAIVLEGNELKSAVDNKDKYYIYLVHEGEITGRFELVGNSKSIKYSGRRCIRKAV